MTLLALTCARCGGELDPDGGPGLLARCVHCHVLGRIDDPEGRQRLVVRPVIDDEAARQAALSLLRHHGFREAPSRLQLERLLVPFWRVETLLLGQLEGERETVERVLRRNYDDDGTVHYRIEQRHRERRNVSEEVQRLHVALVSACPLTELGVPLLDSRRQIHEPLDFDAAWTKPAALTVFSPELRTTATVLDPLITRRAAEAEADQLVTAMVGGLTSDLVAGAEARGEVLHRDASLLYYPLTYCRFELRRQPAYVMVDGTTGRAISYALPASSADRDRQVEQRLFALGGLMAGSVVGGLLHLGLIGPALGAASVAALLLRLALQARPVSDR